MHTGDTVDSPDGPRGPDEWILTLAYVMQNLRLSVTIEGDHLAITGKAKLDESAACVQHFTVPAAGGRATAIGPTTVSIGDHYTAAFPLGFDPWMDADGVEAPALRHDQTT